MVCDGIVFVEDKVLKSCLFDLVKWYVGDGIEDQMGFQMVRVKDQVAS